MRLSRLHRLIKPLLAQPFSFQTPFSFRAHFQAPFSPSRRLLSTNPQATPTPFIDNVATLFNASALSSKERPLHATIILSDGGIEQRDLDRRTLKMESGLAGRDIRVIDGELSSATSILPRARSIVLNFNSIRAVILHNRVAFFTPLSQAALEIIPVLQARLREEDSQKYKHSSSHPRHPFEFHVLECLLLVSCRQHPPPPQQNHNATKTCTRCARLTCRCRRWEQHVHAQTLLVEAALSKVRSMQNDMSNLSLDVLVTLKHDLSGVRRVARGGCRCCKGGG